MLVELDVNVTYSVGGTFEIPDELAEHKLWKRIQIKNRVPN